MDWWIYIVDKGGKFYVGLTTDIENRLRQHGNLCCCIWKGR